MKSLLVMLLLATVGCRSVPQDTTPAPINNNKMTLEMSSCNQTEVGLLGCFYNESMDGSLLIPLWYKGEYQIESERCHYFVNTRYETTEQHSISFKELLANAPEEEASCVYNVKVFIDKFDNGFEGFFVLNKGDIKQAKFSLDNRSYLGFGAIQIREGSDPLPKIKVKADKPGILFWEGCAKNNEIKYKSDPQISISELINEVVLPSSSCILTFGVVPNDETIPVEIGKVYINIFEKTVVPLSVPSLEYKNDKLKVTADKLVSAIAIGEAVSVKHGNRVKTYTQKVPKDREVLVRIMTSNGRYLLMNVKNGEILWTK